MKARFRTKGIILKKEEKDEASFLFKVFTQDFGKLEILGKGIRKISSKLKSAMDTFYLSEIEFVQGRRYNTLVDATLIDKFKNLRKSLKKLAIAYKISEVIENLIKGEEKDERIWKLLVETFKNLDNPYLSPSAFNLIYYYFFWNLISYLGYEPSIYSCSVCQKKLKLKSFYFSDLEGGIVCEKCFLKVKKGKKITSFGLKVLRAIFNKNFEFLKKVKIKKKDLENLKEISQSYLNFLAEKNYEN